FRRAGLRLIVVVPADYGRQGHEDGFRATAGFQPEQGAAVVDEVELGITAATKLLKCPLSVAVGHVLTAANDGHIGAQEGVAGALDEAEQVGEVALKIIEEYAADAARLLAMRQVKVLIA